MDKEKKYLYKGKWKDGKRKKATLNDEDLNKDINEDLNKDINENSYNNDYYNREEESIKETDEYNDDSINFEAIYKDLEDIENKKGEDKHE